MKNCLLKRLDEQVHFPAALVSELQNFANSLPSDLNMDFLDEPLVSQQWIKSVACSRFLRDQLLKHPSLIAQLSAVPPCESKVQFKQHLLAELETLLNLADEPNTLASSLRVFRNRFMACLIHRDINRLQSTRQTCMQLSLLAEAILQATLHFHFRQLQARHGTPRNAQGLEQGLLILGMGKLGAWELNLSSDIDLIFAYPEPGNTDHPSRSLTNAQFFTKLGQAIIQSLDTITAEGFVFRVDMRLRPWGESGALVQHFDELEKYYISQGREWERYAMVKARVVAHNVSAQKSQELSDILERFTYRRYIDFSVIDALRDMKKSISNEVRRKRLFDDIKRGNGGIREVEFIAQVFQLVRGGRDVELRDNRLLRILPALVQLGMMAQSTAQKLEQAYIFLRDSEHAIQAYNDQQTQQLPQNELEQFCLAYAMGFTSWLAYLEALTAHRQLVSEEFSAVIASPKEEQGEELEPAWQAMWQSPTDAVSPALLQKVGDTDARAMLSMLQELRVCREVKNMQALGRQRLDHFMPQLLEGVMHCDSPRETLKRILPLVQTIARRSAYLLLLSENPSSLARLIELAGASPWIAEQLSKNPALLDELLDNRNLYHTPDKQQLQQELSHGLAAIAQ